MGRWISLERRLDFNGLVKKTQWAILKQFTISLIVAYIIPISTISFDITLDSQSFGRELLGIFFNVFSWIYICISLIIIVSINVKALLDTVKKEMNIVYHRSMWLTSGDCSFELTLYEFIETNRHIELMQHKIKNMIQIEKDQKEDILFKVSAMAHDLKTPLTVIKGNTELLQFSSFSEVDEQCLKDIEKASNQLDNYFNQLINYSKTFYENQISWCVYSINDLVAMLEQECLYLIGDIIDYNYHSQISSEGKVNIDLYLIIRSVANIINNAIAYTSETNKKIDVNIGILEDKLIISIWNSGSKFSPEVLDNFGKLFFREDISRGHKTEHFGIGLAFVRQVMNLHSGEINLQNKNDGAQVDLLIPLYHPYEIK